MLLLAALLGVADPATPAPPLPPAPLAVSEDGFGVGVDTLASVTAKLGRPTASQANSDGTHVAIYTATKTHIKGSSFIPIVGLFTAGARASLTVKTFTFGADGVLKSFSTTDSSNECDTTMAGMKCGSPG